MLSANFKPFFETTSPIFLASPAILANVFRHESGFWGFFYSWSFLSFSWSFFVISVCFNIIPVIFPFNFQTTNVCLPNHIFLACYVSNVPTIAWGVHKTVSLVPWRLKEEMIKMILKPIEMIKMTKKLRKMTKKEKNPKTLTHVWKHWPTWQVMPKILVKLLEKTVWSW